MYFSVVGLLHDAPPDRSPAYCTYCSRLDTALQRAPRDRGSRGGSKNQKATMALFSRFIQYVHQRKMQAAMAPQ
jgi:hypothetical protein